MKFIDSILALISGVVIAFLVTDFFGNLGLVPWILLPIVSLVCLWVAYLIGKKIIIIFQVAKHLLVGAVATIVDLKLFELLSAAIFFVNPLIIKSISFLLSIALKYVGNKYWAFQKNGKDHIKREIAQFFLITLVGLTIDVFVFYCATELLGPQLQITEAVWTKLSVIFAALAAAIWNFSGYKFLVFKK